MTRSSHVDVTPPSLRRFTKLVAASTLFLIFAGAMVTSTGSGLAVPDWPNTYGEFMFKFPLSKMVGGIFYEHGHRLIASTVGLLTIIQAVWLQRREPRRYVRVLGWIALAAVIVQGLLGGLTVLLLLPPAISIAHAGLAEIFFCLTVSIAFFTSRFHSGLERTGNTAVGSTTALFVLVYLQILAGAVMRHLGAGLAIPDFPLSFGRLVPEFVSTAIAVNYAHRLGAVVVAVAAAIVIARTRSWLLALLVIVQILLGASTVWSGKQPHITSLHVVTGAATLALSLILMLKARATAIPIPVLREATA
ncbi:MAG TPA: COX15/CtaA family protein [Thermoanaerobaculia bacterium]|nr:COX15/CtaA family protein [Thermoanaerobaculia bacterium]